MTRFHKFLAPADGTKLRNLARAAIAAGITFGLRWSGEQVGATMIVVEAALALIVREPAA